MSLTNSLLHRYVCILYLKSFLKRCTLNRKANENTAVIFGYINITQGIYLHLIRGKRLVTLCSQVLSHQQTLEDI